MPREREQSLTKLNLRSGCRGKYQSFRFFAFNGTIRVKKRGNGGRNFRKTGSCSMEGNLLVFSAESIKYFIGDSIVPCFESTITKL